MDKPRSNEAGPSSSGQEEAAAAKAGVKKTKFMPNVTARRKKGAEGNENVVTAADAAAVNAEFQDLIEAAQAGSTWQRGRGGRGGRGSQAGRGIGVGGASQQVTFGGSSFDRPTLAAAKPSRAPGAGSGVAGKPGAGGGTRVKAEGGDGKEEPEEEEEVLVGAKPGDDIIEDVKRFVLQDALDYSQYYPTTLPLQPPGESYRSASELDKGAPKDLAVTADVVTNAADELGLLRLDEEQQHMFLVQLPHVLPISAAARSAAVAAAAAAAAAAGASASEPPVESAAAAAAARRAAAAAGPAEAAALRGCALKDLPSSSIGKLLVFRSGKVKLQMGDVLMDVNPGLICQHRMDAAAINCQAGHCVLLGDVGKRMVVSPDIWQLMEDKQVPKYVSPGGKGSEAMSE